MKRRLTKILVLVLSLIALISFTVACTPQHVHEYAQILTYNAEFHWFECECGEDKGSAEHVFNDGKCVCGYEKTEEGGGSQDAPTTPENPSHTHNFITNFDNDKHWKECSCGEKNEIVQHAYTDNKCSCGYTKPQSGHTHTAGEWITETSATCIKVGYRYKKCTDCGAVIETGQLDYTAHDYVYGECSVCSAIDSTYMTEGLMFVLNEEDDVYEVVGYNGIETKIIIPEIYRGKNVIIPDGEYDGGSYGVFSNVAIEEAIINAKKIGDYAFNPNKNIKKVVMGDRVESIGMEAFDSCENLEQVVLSNSITSLDFFEFYGSKKLQFNEKDGAKYLGSENNLYFCLYEGVLGDIIISNDCKIIREGALISSEIISITIPESVVSLVNVFRAPFHMAYGGRNVSRIDVAEGNMHYKSIDGSLYTKDGKELLKYAGGKTATEFSIPDCVESIGGAAFVYCSNLISVIIPDSVRSISYDAFYGCSSLESVVIPNSVESIGDYVFGGCSSLTIYCETESKPDGWYNYWNNDRPVVWGYKG